MLPVQPVCDLSDLELPSLLEALAQPSIVVDGDYRIVAANQRYRDAFAGGDRVCGRRCFEASHQLTVPCDEIGQTCPLAGARTSGAPTPAVHLHHTADGERFETTTVYPLTSTDGEVHYFLEVLDPTQLASTDGREGESLCGRSEAFARLLELVGRVATTATTVLLLGESGTGKDLVARAIHRASARRSGPFVPLDCSGLTETLFESELFGHERGSFTGAHERKRGLVEAADGGTLFLDEVGDIPQALQVKLLRLIETGVFRRVGSVALRRSDFRLVCATHRDLEAKVRSGSFREDLYYRISVFPIRLPPLRERIEDLPLLAESLFRRLGCGTSCRLAPEALQELERHSFPGNVRELHNLLERACLLADGGEIRSEHLPVLDGAEVPSGGERGPIPLDARAVLPVDDVEARYVRWAAARFQGSRAELAAKLGISERTLYRKLRSS